VSRAAGGAGWMHEIHTKFPDPFPYGTFDIRCANVQAALPILGSWKGIEMNKQTSANVSHLAGIILNAKADGNEKPDDFARLLHDAKVIAGSCMSQDETPGQGKIPPHTSTPKEFTAAEIATDQILHFFHYAHLPEQLRATSRLFFMLASEIIHTVPRNPERTVALRKLLEAKDAAVRANLPVASFGSEKAPVASDRTLGEAREIGGHDEDRDGPVPFNG
jgi:hypothetical protein